MDTSNKYIGMCEKAFEIQNRTNKEMGDLVVNTTCLLARTGSDRREKRFTYLKLLGFNYGNIDYIWLPKQDQLQEMVDGTYLAKLVDISNFSLNISYIHIFESLEQLWLAFVMKEKYNKQWDGTDWVVV